ncbi:MAG TPA: hypothetical protein DHV92_05420 [Ruminococcaceae bacterium]|jgi:hypothetical protein|nr:hypothetical protein [Oscillospiraceae bacterium]
MFDNVGSKIKALASFFCWGGIIASVIGGIIVITLDEDLVWAGLAVIIIGSLLSWVSSFVLYGFGELVVNSAIIAGKEGKIVVGGQSGNTVAPQNKSEKITALNNLKARGLISEEEYSKKLAELESKR